MRNHLQTDELEDQQNGDDQRTNKSSLAATEAFIGRTISSTGCVSEHVVNDKSHVLPVGYPHMHTGGQAHRDRVLPPGDRDGSL